MLPSSLVKPRDDDRRPGPVGDAEQPRLLESPASSSDHLAGTVERVTFHNEENGFSVLRVLARGRREPVTVVATPRRSRSASSSRPKARG